MKEEVDAGRTRRLKRRIKERICGCGDDVGLGWPSARLWPDFWVPAPGTETSTGVLPYLQSMIGLQALYEVVHPGTRNYRKILIAHTRPLTGDC